MIFYMIFHENTISGWWLTYPSEKYEWTSVGMMKFPIFGKSFKIPWFQSPPARFCHDKSTRLISEKWKIGKVVLQVTASRAAGRLRGVASGAPKERTALGGTVPFLGVHGHFLRGVTAMYSCGG